MLSQTPPNGTPDETTLRNLQAPAPTENAPAAGSRPPGLPYGAGYEHRQQDMQGPGGGAGCGRGWRAARPLIPQPLKTGNGDTGRRPFFVRILRVVFWACGGHARMRL